MVPLTAEEIHKELSELIRKTEIGASVIYSRLVRSISEVYRDMHKYVPSNIRKLVDVRENKDFVSALEDVMRTFDASMRDNVRDGQMRAWELANKHNDILIKTITDSEEDKYHDKSEEYLLAAITKGDLSASKAISTISKQVRSLIELGVAYAIMKGLTHRELDKSMREDIRAPKKLFKRIRDEYGEDSIRNRYEPTLHPGIGRYTSPYQESRRAINTGVHAAYCSSQEKRWSLWGIVVGKVIGLSPTHPRYDICDELVGIYPPWYRFRGFHPYCRCIQMPIIYMGGGHVDSMPSSFESWKAENMDRIINSSKKGTLPYFIKDNFDVSEDGDFIVKP